MNNAPLIVACLLLVDSLHFVFARLLLPHLPPQTSALLVLGVATIETAAYLAARRQIRFQVFRQHAPFFLAIGFLVAASTTANYTAVAFIDPGTASLLSQTSIIFALVFGLYWLREKLGYAELLGAAVALIGVFIVSFQPGDYLRLGSLLVLSSAFMYALHAAIVKRHGGEMDFANFFLFRVASTTGFLLLFTVLRGTHLANGAFSLDVGSGTQLQAAWPFLLLAGTVDVVISRVLYYLALRRLQITFHAILLTLSPVITILWSLLLFGTRPTVQGFFGGAAVLAGVLLVTMSRAKQPTAVKAEY